MKLSELAVRYKTGFDVDDKRWNEIVEENLLANEIKQLNDSSFIKELSGNYSLWVNNEIVSVAFTNKKKIDNRSCINLVALLTDPTKNKRGYGSSLLWELYLAVNDPIFIGGAISPTGEKLISSFIDKHHEALTSVPQLIDELTGEKTDWDENKIFTNSKLGLLLEFGGFIPGKQGPFWLFNENAFTSNP